MYINKRILCILIISLFACFQVVKKYKSLVRVRKLAFVLYQCNLSFRKLPLNCVNICGFQELDVTQLLSAQVPMAAKSKNPRSIRICFREYCAAFLPEYNSFSLKYRYSITENLFRFLRLSSVG